VENDHPIGKINEKILGFLTCGKSPTFLKRSCAKTTCTGHVKNEALFTIPWMILGWKFPFPYANHGAGIFTYKTG
jgi:hypothetical protein